MDWQKRIQELGNTEKEMKKQRALQKERERVERQRIIDDVMPLVEKVCQELAKALDLTLQRDAHFASSHLHYQGEHPPAFTIGYLDIALNFPYITVSGRVSKDNELWILHKYKDYITYSCAGIFAVYIMCKFCTEEKLTSIFEDLIRYR